MLGHCGHATNSNHHTDTEPYRQGTDAHGTESYTDDYSSDEVSRDANSHECHSKSAMFGDEERDVVDHAFTEEGPTQWQESQLELHMQLDDGADVLEHGDYLSWIHGLA
jgi:hypothetical protein